MTLNPDIEFRTPQPPAKRQGRVDWTSVDRELRGAPNEWGYIGVFSSGVASGLRAGRYVALHPHGHDQDKASQYMSRHWEVTVRKVENGKYELYLRWLG